jgi:very-short-patch-repair endonuclease
MAVLALGGDRRLEGVCLAGLTALVAWGLRTIEMRCIDVLTTTGQHPTPPRGVRLHRTSAMPHVHRRAMDAPLTLAGRALVDAVQWAASDRQALLLVAASFQQRLVSLADVESTLAQLPRAKRRNLLRATARDAAGGSESLAELDLLALCRRAGIPEPSRQVKRRDTQGRLRFIDALFEEWKVAVEVDGAHHLLVAQMWDDAEKANSLELAGYVVLRYPAFALRQRGPHIAAEIRQALISAGWRP